METPNKSTKENNTANVLWTQYGEEQPKYANLRLLTGACRPPRQRESTIDTNLKDQWLRRLISCGDQPPTGELGARNSPAQFGGRGDLIRRSYPICPRPRILLRRGKRLVYDQPSQIENDAEDDSRKVCQERAPKHMPRSDN